MIILSTVGTENTYTPARLEELFKKLSVVIIRTIQDSTSKFPCERLRSQSIPMFREEICSVVLRELVEVRVAPQHCTVSVQLGRV